MADWIRTTTTTIKNYIKGYEPETLRNRAMLVALKKKGRITYNESGDGRDWKVSYRYANVEQNNGEGQVTYARQPFLKTAQLDWRGLVAADAITKREHLKNRNTAAIVKTYGGMGERLVEAISEKFGEVIYQDGNATGNEDSPHGLESMFGSNGTVTITTGAQRSANAADKLAYPNDTYAGLTTGLGDYGGSQLSGVWPNGTADSEFDFWSPIMVNYTSSAFSGSADTWAEQCLEAMRFGFLQAGRNKGPKGMVDLVVLERDLYNQFLNKLDSRERVMAADGLGLRAFGFDTVELDGKPITHEYGLPYGTNGTVAASAQGYGMNLDYIELFSAQDDLFDVEPIYYDAPTRTYRLAVDFLGNLKFHSPRNFVKFGNWA